LEAHRVGTPRDAFNNTNVDGAYLGTFGEITGWNVYVGDASKDRYVPASAMLQIMEYDRPSAVRGYAVLQSSLNSVQDHLEVFGLEVMAARTGKMLVVDTNEDLTQLAQTRPSAAWMGMMTAIERDIVRLLPYEYQVTPGVLGGSSVRLVAGRVSRWAGKWQSILIDSLDRVYDYVIADGIAKGKIPDDPDFNRKTWITPRDITVDAPTCRWVLPLPRLSSARRA
ncbi:hypothetical protein JZU57_00835, partial [bacterium]|nr:hypothetical protein [bacterium]